MEDKPTLWFDAVEKLRAFGSWYRYGTQVGYWYRGTLCSVQVLADWSIAAIQNTAVGLAVY